MSLTKETKDAVDAWREEHGGRQCCSYRRALRMVMGQRAADAWNAKWPVGTACVVELSRRGLRCNTRTRSAAWVMPDGSAVAKVDGRAGCWGLDWLTPGGHEEGLPMLELPT